MKIVLQRVLMAAVEVEQTEIGAIENGLLLLVGFGKGEPAPNINRAAEKIAGLRVFENDQGKPHFSLLDIGAGVLVIPQFTLYGETAKGRRPAFSNAMPPAEANEHFAKFVNALHHTAIKHVATGRFGANMKVSSINDGPFTLLMEF